MTNNIAFSSAPQPRYEVRFNPQHFEDDINSSGKPIGFQEIWQALADGWWLAAHVVRDEAGVYVRKAFARRGLRADGSWEQSVAVGTYDVAATADSIAEKSVTDDYLASQYGWAAKKRA
jgi:hypothetical protein